jgi:hypothetical protein
VVRIRSTLRFILPVEFRRGVGLLAETAIRSQSCG